MTLTPRWAIAALSVSLLVVDHAALAAADGPKLRLSSDERRRMYDLLREYPNKRKDPARQGEIVDELVALGPVAASQMMKRLDREFRMKQPRYRMMFDRAAARAAAAKEKDADRKQIDADLALLKAQEANPTKGNADKAWPAMQRLKEVYRLDCKAVVAGDETLSAAREEILRLGTWLDMCRAPVIAGLEAQGRDASSIEVGDTPFDTRLAMQDAGSATRALSIARKHAPTLKANEAALAKVHAEVAAGVSDLNMMRMIMGHAPLRIDLKLCDAARGHCEDMKERNFFDHTSPVPGKRTFLDRAKLAGTSARGENIARGQSRALDANKGWFYSPGHFTNMFNAGFKRIGFGFAGKFWTQVFG